MSEKLLVPDIGDFEKVEVIEVLAKEGDQLNINDPVITIESDKSSVEIPSTINGKVEKVEVKVGDKVSKGDIILNIVSSGESVKNNPIPIIIKREPEIRVGMMYALAISVFPSCQNPKLAAINTIPKRMKNGVEKSSAFAQSVDALNISMVLFLITHKSSINGV